MSHAEQAALIAANPAYLVDRNGEVLRMREVSAERESMLERQVRDLQAQVNKLSEDLSESTRQRKSQQAMYNAVFNSMRGTFQIPDNVNFSEFGRWIRDAMKKRSERPNDYAAIEGKWILPEPRE